MTKRQIAGGLLVGLGAGLATGYYLPIMGKPKITIQGSTWTFSGFPPFVPLMSMGGGTGGIGSAPIDIGQTDANGKLVLTGVPQVPEGNTVLYVVYVATEPSIFATVVIKF